MENMPHTGRRKSFVIVVDICRRWVLILAAKKANHRAPNLACERYRRRIPRAQWHLHAPSIKDGYGGELGQMTRREPRHAPTPAVPDNTDRSLGHIRTPFEQPHRRLEIEHRPIIAALVPLDLHLRFFGPPVKQERRGHDIAIVGKALGRPQRKLVIFEPGVPDWEVLQQDERGPWRGSPRLENEDLHRAAIDIHNLCFVHRRLLCGVPNDSRSELAAKEQTSPLYPSVCPEHVREGVEIRVRIRGDLEMRTLERSPDDGRRHDPIPDQDGHVPANVVRRGSCHGALARRRELYGNGALRARIVFVHCRYSDGAHVFSIQHQLFEG
jgi:hypothetical protein